MHLFGAPHFPKHSLRSAGRRRHSVADLPSVPARPRGAGSGAEGLSLLLQWEAMRDGGIQPT